jgi:hypothetical protein
MLDARRDGEPVSGLPAHLIKDGLTLAVLALSGALFNFCLGCLRVVWPRGFKGESRHDIDRCSNYMEDGDCAIGTGRHLLVFTISIVIWLVYDVYLVRIVCCMSNTF